MNSSEINKYFINLLSNIYSFSFHYENCMKSILKLFEPLILNLNNKNLDEIHNELELSDLILNYLEGLNNKEKALSDQDGCLLKNGFYFGNKSSAIYGDINSNLETDFIILFIFLNLRFTPENIGNSLILFLILSSLIYLIFTILFLRKPSVVK